MAPSHPQLVWPRSDGDRSKWPQHTQPGNSGWFDQLPPEHAKYKLYREKVGKYVATEILGLTGLANPLIDMPEGYALYAHCKPQPNGSVREDVYMYGSTFVGKFRSPQEFLPHAAWLFDKSKALNHNLCGCKYNTLSSLAQEKKAGTNSPKRDRGPDSKDTPDAKRPKTAQGEPVIVERALDAQYQRRYRKGELVFFRVPTISSPTPGMPDITHWPGLIASINMRTKVTDNGIAGASLSAAWSIAGAEPPAHLKPEVTVIAEHSIRPLGLFANTHEVKRGTEELLPWSIADELLGGQDGWNKIGNESSRILNESILRETQVDIPTADDLHGTGLDLRWRRRFGERIPFSEMPMAWDAAIFRLGVGLRIGRHVAASWSQTDKIEVCPPGSSFTPEDLEAFKNRKKTLYQGLWYQGERIWVEDMVRVRRERHKLPTDVLLPPGPGAADRAVLLQVRMISLEHVDPPSQADGQPAADREDYWRCLLYGDLYELADGPIVPGDVQPSARTRPAPDGTHYRRLNGDTTEVNLDIFDVAGRVYPDLLTKDNTWFYTPEQKDGDRAGRVEAGPVVQGIVGLRPRTQARTRGDWKSDLYILIRDATTKVENELKDAYAHRMRRALGYPAPEKANGAKTSAPTTPAVQAAVAFESVKPESNKAESVTA